LNVIVNKIVLVTLLLCISYSGTLCQNANVVTNSRWASTQTEITVCWDNYNPNYISEYVYVESAIQNTWERYSSLKFTDWGKCQDKSYNLRIIVSDTICHTKGYGVALNNRDSAIVLNFTFEKWGCTLNSIQIPCADNESVRKNRIKSYAIHEFGHALGFAHEHAKESCKKCHHHATENDFQKQQEAKGIIWYSKGCDENSVMNYCRPNSIDPQLSDCDIYALQINYGYSTTEREVTDCRPRSWLNAAVKEKSFKSGGGFLFAAKKVKVEYSIVYSSSSQICNESHSDYIIQIDASDSDYYKKISRVKYSLPNNFDPDQLTSPNYYNHFQVKLSSEKPIIIEAELIFKDGEKIILKEKLMNM